MTNQKLHIGADGISALVDLAPEEITQREIDRTASIARDAELAVLAKQQAAREDTQAALMQALADDLRALEGGGRVTAQEQCDILARVVRAMVG